MNKIMNNKIGLNNIKKRDNKNFSNKKKIYNKNYLTQYLTNNKKVKPQNNKQTNTNNSNISINNSEINSNYIIDTNNKNIRKLFQFSQPLRNKSMNNLLTLNNINNLFRETPKVCSTYYNYNCNNFDNTENGIINNNLKINSNIKAKMNPNKKKDIINKDNINNINNLNNNINNLSNNINNLNKTHNFQVNDLQPMYSTELTEDKIHRYYHDIYPQKYYYGGTKLIISKNTNNHSYKEIIGKSASSDKILNKSRVINFADTNNVNTNIVCNNIYKYNYDFDGTEFSDFSPKFNLQTDMNYNSYKINNKNKNNDNLINNNINNKKLKKSTSANYSFGRLSKSKNNINNKSRNNNTNDFNKIEKVTEKNRNNNNKKDNNYKNSIYTNYNFNNKLIEGRNIYINDYILKYEKEKNINNKKNISNKLNIKNNDDLNIKNNENINDKNNKNNINDNFKYFYNFKKNYYQPNHRNKKTLLISNSVDNLKSLKFTYSKAIDKSYNNLFDSLNYDNFKLKVKLGILRKQIKNEKFITYKVKANTNYIYDKKFFEKIMNNNKRKEGIKDMSLIKTKKSEEKKIKKEKKNNINNKNNNKKDFKYKTLLLEKNKGNDKYVVNHKFNIFKS